MEANCIICRDFGSPQEVLRVEQKKVEPPQDDEILVRMLARPINPSDLIPVSGSYAHRISLPHIPGYEGVGIVEQAGPLAPHHLVGTRVLPLRGEGTWQEYVKTQGKWAVPVPDRIDHFTAAQMYINPVTAWVVCTEVLNLSFGDVLAVNACGSAIGRLFAQLARVLGFRLIAVTRDDRHTEQLLQLGASAVIHAAEQNIAEAMWELTDGRGVHAAIDSVGGAAGNELAYGGPAERNVFIDRSAIGETGELGRDRQTSGSPSQPVSFAALEQGRFCCEMAGNVSAVDQADRKPASTADGGGSAIRLNRSKKSSRCR